MLGVSCKVELNMRFTDEIQFENHLRELINQQICSSNNDIVVFENKNLADIVICKNNETSGIYFIEVKHLKPRMGRLGFGGRNGSGFQPEILKKRPKYLESNLIWVLYSEVHENNDGIVVLTSKELCDDFLQGGSVADKYNGIQQNVFDRKDGITDEKFIEYISKWLNS